MFEPDVAEYLTVVKNKAEEFNLITFVAAASELYPTESQQEKARQQQAELANYFFGQLREIRGRFAPYLKINLPRKSLVDRIEGAISRLP